ncbi:MAG: phosphoribosyltransferase [Gammaproteobacteria bacterium]
MDKKILSAQELLLDSFRLGGVVLRDQFRPTLIVAIWRGGTPVGMALQEMMAYCGVDADHIAIRTSSYSGTEQIDGKVRVHGLNYIVKKIRHDDSVLIVDDVFDTGNTIVSVIEQLRLMARKNMPDNVRVAVPWFKPKRNQTDMVPHYYVHSTDEWLVFPHELDSLTAEELREHRGELYDVMHPGGAG